MDDDFALKDFSNVVRLFPLPGVVLFPHAVLPLHIFEPRYRQMTEDALATDRLITIVQVRPPAEWTAPDLPALEAVGCIGRIVKHERLADGKFNFLLLGCRRVELTREIATGKLYRMSELKLIEEIAPEQPDARSRTEMVDLFRQAHGGAVDPDLDSIFGSDLPLGVLTDIMAQALGLSSTVKQKFLAEPRVARRASGMIDLLRQMKDRPDPAAGDSTPFPPPFSRN